MRDKLSAQELFMIFIMIMTLLFALAFKAAATEKEDLAKDLQIMSLTVEKNLYQNEFLKVKAQEINQKIKAIEKAEAEKAKKNEKAPAN